MIKLVCFFRRLPDMSIEAFHRHWLEEHGPLIAGTPELARHLVRYEQNHRLEWDYRRDDPAQPGFDGGTVQWMESMDSFLAFVREPKYAELVAPDEGRFIDRSSIELLFTQDDDVKIDGGATRGEAELKRCALFRRREGMSAEDFHRHWGGAHARLLSERPEISRHLIAYHQSRRLESDYAREGGFDGLAEQWFDSQASMKALLEEPAYAEVTSDIRSITDADAARTLLSGPPDVIIG